MGGTKAGLGDFLRTRRDGVRPEDVGIPGYGTRRVPGLRRSELAQLAGLSTEYLVRLEQGQDTHPSDAILDALSRALMLDDIERAYLHALAGSTRRGQRDCQRRRAPQRVRPAVRRLLDAIPTSPTTIVGRGLEILDQNAASIVLLGDLRDRNLLRLLFLDDRAAATLDDWERTATEAVGHLRAQAAANGTDRGLCELVGELTLGSDTFSHLWAAHQVRARMTGRTRFTHPQVGEIDLDYEMLALPDAEQWLVVSTAAPGSPSETALNLLGTLNAPAAAES